VCFADPNLWFDFANVRKEFARGALREFQPAGERTIVSPGRKF
jgi:methyl-coenzyme M reductase alpha subunit